MTGIKEDFVRFAHSGAKRSLIGERTPQTTWVAMLRTLHFVHENPCFSGQTLSFLHFVHEKCRFSGQKLLFFVHQKCFSKPLSVVLLLNLQSSGFEQSSLFQSEPKFYWGAYSPRVFFKTTFEHSSPETSIFFFSHSLAPLERTEVLLGSVLPKPLESLRSE